MKISVLIVFLPVFFIGLIKIYGQTKAKDLTIEPFKFEASNQPPVEAERGFLTVPENRNNPKSRLIQIAFVRFKSTSPNPGSPIVYLAGGPGSSGIGAARGARFSLFMAMREIGDLIALDQRGVGQSKPNLVCKENINFPPETIPTDETLAKHFQDQFQICVNNFKQQGVNLRGYNSNENADDIEDLRKAIGAKKISLWAISYGTHLALATVKRHEKSIDKMILAGTEGLSDTIKLPGNIEKHLQHLDQMLKSDPNLRKKIPSLVGLMKEVLEKV